MNNEEEFKDIVRDLLNEREFQYEESNWEKASRILDQKEKGKKRFLFFILFGIGFGLALLSYKIFLSGDDHVQSASKSANNNIQQHLNSKGNNVTASETAHESMNKISKNKHKTAEISNSNNIITEQHKEQDIKLAIGNSNNKQTTEKKHAVRPIASNGLNQSSLFIKRVNKKNSVKEVVQKNNSQPEIKTHGKIVSVADSNNAVIMKDSNKKYEYKQELPKMDSAIGFTSLDSKGLKVDSGKTATKDVLLSEINSVVTKSETIIKVDSVALAATQPSVGIAQLSHYLNAEVGGYFNAGWKHGGVREGLALNSYFGLMYLNKSSEKLALSIGAYYSTVNNLSQSSKTIKVSKNVFGEESDVTVITPISLAYFNVPVGIHYMFNDKSSIAACYSFSYLLDVRSRVETYSEQWGSIENSKSAKVWGYRAGFKNFSSQLSVGYRREIYPNLSINSEIVIGLSDLRDDTFFSIRYFERAFGIRMSLSYNLFKK